MNCSTLHTSLISLAFSALVVQCGCIGQGTEKTNDPEPLEHALILFYNVENLFDTINDPHTNDDEFLPNTEKNWNSERYWKKVNDLSKVIISADGSALPDVIGLSEIENDAVLLDLSRNDILSKKNYEYIHRNGPDPRGIDVAALYDPIAFELEHTTFYTITLNDSLRPHTREVLYFSGLLHGKVIHFFVTHWPSRRGGTEASEPKRVQVAELIRSKVDSIEQSDPSAMIVIMGDLNDHPTDHSVYNILGAKEDTTNADLVDLFHDEHVAANGTYNYRGDWGILDHFIVSANMLSGNGPIKTNDRSARVIDHEWLLYHDEKHDDHKPSATYGGPNYYGGYSDHLPILLELEIQ